MQEKVGNCAECGGDVYCRGGFLQGVVQEDGTLICFSCMDEAEGERDPD
ncbi:hypothetical protein [Paenibacillus soyae]|uniref:Uncharacterized protein n=1 Tax=Paenibacillus soyae TaxID=2969249 RepID=A0A9X2MLC3_9BACL|nr:hypothetical protein [Paenibacillus soyae]MCR2804103.1 hypothetical protein [Paenibacillus soyae]